MAIFNSYVKLPEGRWTSNRVSVSSTTCDTPWCSEGLPDTFSASFEAQHAVATLGYATDMVSYTEHNSIPKSIKILQNVKQGIDTFVLFIPIWQIPTLLTLFYNFILFYAPYFLAFRSFPKPLDGYPNHWMVSFHWEPIFPHDES